MIILNKSIPNIKFPKTIYYQNQIHIFGLKSLCVDKTNNISKFIVVHNIYDLEFNLLLNNNLSNKFPNDKSILIWNIEELSDAFKFLIEYKSIDTKTHSSQYYHYYIEKNSINTINTINTNTNKTYFNIINIEKLQLENHLIFNYSFNTNKTDKIILSSEITKDEDRPDYYWGKYLFTFYSPSLDNKIIPQFDKIVNYQKDKGHIIHSILNKGDYYWILFSIRHVINNNNDIISINNDNNTKYYYQIYESTTTDFKTFKNTKKVNIINNISNSKWYCYPNIIIIDDKYYVLINQDDFGKEKETLIGTINI